MSAKRAILDALTRDELIAVVERFALPVADRRVREQLLSAIDKARSATPAAILAELPRARLKDLCRALGLDESGREKAVIIERLLGAPAAPSPPAPRAAAQIPLPMAAPAPDKPRAEGTLSRDQLERHLWSAADILRGSIDSSDYKSYIFGLLFLKRLSDRFDEECAALQREGVDPESRDEHDFFVPLRSRWSELRKATTHLGDRLNKACEALEEDNPALDGVLAGIDYNDQNKLGDAKARDAILGRLVQHFSGLSLRNTDLSEPDLLGRAYEYLIEKFADDAGKKGGEFYTPRGVVKLLVELLAPQPGMRICDPTCGSGGMLVECAHYLARRGQDPRNLSLFGQEKNLGTWAICQMNMLLHGIQDFKVAKGDTIRDPKLLQDGKLLRFDRVIANPPFSLDEWGREAAEADALGRFRYGVPPKTKGDLAFVQHMVATLNERGRLAVVMPHGVLFRGSSEGEIRKGLLADDLIEAVIGLPPNLFYGTGIPAAVLVMSRAKAKERRGRVLFIDASREFKEGSNQNLLREEDIARISAAFKAGQDVGKYARLVPVAEVEKNEWNLNISRYVDTAQAQEKVDVSAAVAKLRELEGKRAEAEARMNGFLKELGYEVASPGLALLEQVAHVQTGIAKGKVLEGPARSIPYLRVANVQDGFVDLHEIKCIDVSADLVSRYALQRDDVLFTEGGDADKLGRGCVWRGQIEPCLHQNHVFAVRADRERIVPKFLAYYAASPAGRTYFLTCAKQTTNLASINSTQLKALPVPTPPIREQQKIVAVLSAVDEAIDATKAVIAQLQVVKKAMMAELLTRGIPGRHTRFKVTELGKIPAEWEVQPIGTQGMVDAGKAKDPRATGVPRPYLRVANVFDGRISTEDVLEMPFTLEEFARFELNNGDVLLNEGQSIDLVGRCSIYRGELGRPCAIQNALLRFRAGTAVLSEYAEQFFRWCQHSGKFAEVATQTTSIAHLGLKRFASMLMTVPSLDEQRQMIEMLKSIDEKAIMEVKAKRSLEDVKSTLLSSLLSGEVRVTPDP